MILFTAAAMGLQSVAATALGIRGVTTTYITGTWTAMMSGLTRRIPLEHVDEADPPPGTGIQAAVLGVYLLAAVVGGLAEARWHLLALAVPSAAVGTVVGASWWWLRQRNP